MRVVDVTRVPASAYLGVLGMPGLTAYVGLTRIAPVREGETVFVSGAAGAVGSAPGRWPGCSVPAEVVGSAGSPEKVDWVTRELGFDAAFDYQDGPVTELLEQHAPIDVYFDNVGGEHLEAAISALADFGRVAACGAIASYNETDPSPGPRNMFLVVTKRLRIQGFIVLDHGDVPAEFTSGWRMVRRRQARLPRDGGRRARQRGGRVPRAAPRREHRQDAHPTLTAPARNSRGAGSGGQVEEGSAQGRAKRGNGLPFSKPSSPGHTPGTGNHSPSWVWT